MSKKIKVLHVGMSPNYGGIESYVVNVYNHLDREKFHFDFINTSVFPLAYEQYLLKNGSKIFNIPTGIKNYYKVQKKIRSIINDEKYDYIHFHLLSYACFFIILCALSSKKSKVILHSHTTGYSSNSSIKEKILHSLGKILLINKNVLRLACTNNAGKWLHSNRDFTVVNNGIDYDKYTFNDSFRKYVRKKYKINESDILIGNVTNFSYPKNNMYLLKVFLELYKINHNYKLVIIGDDKKGSDEKQFIRNNNLNDRVIFTGLLKDVSKIYSAMDLYICPSIIEGFSISILEACANGLPCYISHRISKNVFPGKIKTTIINIDSDPSDVAFFINDNFKKMKLKRSKNYFLKDYRIEYCSKKLQDYYMQHLESKNIVSFDTSFGTQNIGDNIIVNSIENEMKYLFDDYFIVRYSSHNPIAGFFDNVSNKINVACTKDTKYRFLLGANTIKYNLFIRHPDLNINLFDIPRYKNTIAVGVGSDINSKKMNFYTKFIYKNILSKEYIHSTRDERTKNILQSLGLKAINTGCPTLWSVTDKICLEIPRKKSKHNVVFTLTCYDKDVYYDQQLINILNKNYTNVYFFPQGYDDLEYFYTFKDISNIKIVNPNLYSFEKILQKDIDYVGTRLHAGIFSMKHKKRSIIISIDNRARDMQSNNNLTCIERVDIDKKLDKMINSSFSTKIIVDHSKINEWKSQFK